MLNLIFDLDGTLVDSRGTIHASLNHTLDTLGYPVMEPERTRDFIGSPLLDIFTGAFGMDRNQAERAIGIYRVRYAELGHQGTEVYPRVAETLEILAAAGHRLFIATVKPGPVARQVLKAQDFLRFFAGVSGSSMDSTRKDKAEIIAHSVQTNGLEAPDSVMIGDRYHDIEGARANGLRAIGVSYGYGSREELHGAGADTVLECLSELPACLGTLLESGVQKQQITGIS